MSSLLDIGYRVDKALGHGSGVDDLVYTVGDGWKKYSKKREGNKKTHCTA